MEVDVSTIKFVSGVFLGILGSVLINTGNNIQSLGLQESQKKSRNKTDSPPSPQPKSRTRNKKRVHIASTPSPSPPRSRVSVKTHTNNFLIDVPSFCYNEPTPDGTKTQSESEGESGAMNGSTDTGYRMVCDADEAPNNSNKISAVRGEQTSLSSSSFIGVSEEMKEANNPKDKACGTLCPDDSHSHEASSLDTDPFQSSTWKIGTFVFVTGSLVNFASYMFGAQSLLASLESIQFVTNILYGKYMFGVAIEGRMLLGTGMVVSGTILAIQFSSKNEQEYVSMELLMLYANPAYITYLFLSVVVGILTYSCNGYYQDLANKGIFPFGSSVIMPVTFSVYSALFGTQSVTLAKSLGELIEAQLSGKEDIFLNPFVYVNIIVWVVFVTIWLTRLNEALMRYEPLFIIPLLQSNFIFFSIINGGIYFREFESFSPSEITGFSGGMFVMFLGLYFLRPIPKTTATTVTDGGGTVTSSSNPDNNNTENPQDSITTTTTTLQSSSTKTLARASFRHSFAVHVPPTVGSSCADNGRVFPLPAELAVSTDKNKNKNNLGGGAATSASKPPIRKCLSQGAEPRKQQTSSSPSRSPHEAEPVLDHRCSADGDDTVDNTVYTPDTMLMADNTPYDEEQTVDGHGGVPQLDREFRPQSGSSVVSSNPSTEFLPNDPEMSPTSGLHRQPSISSIEEPTEALLRRLNTPERRKNLRPLSAHTRDRMIRPLNVKHHLNEAEGAGAIGAPGGDDAGRRRQCHTAPVGGCRPKEARGIG